MTKKINKTVIILWICVILVLLAASFFVAPPDRSGESIKEQMRDAVLHDVNKINFLGIKDVNPAFISAVVVTSFLLLAGVCIRLFVIPKFQIIPSKFQLLLEQLVGFFASFAKEKSPHRYRFLSAYIFGAGMYIFFGTLFELFGIQAVTVNGRSIALPAPLADINGAIALGCLSYLIVLFGGFFGNGFKGVGSALKDFTMPLSMSFRLFGALLSGVLVTELLYHYISLSFGLPVVAGVLFTLLHALVQTYVLIMLTATSYGEASHKKERK
ncbi:MAG: F0F1 ATP synthase subunit A [Clostridia bacterium]|jgi:F-type H+-transporting ATPase subunit a|nr:F0F1 ATP synthase subunit A [Clostridiaceae bacterium]